MLNHITGYLPVQQPTRIILLHTHYYRGDAPLADVVIGFMCILGLDFMRRLYALTQNYCAESVKSDMIFCMCIYEILV